MGGLHGKPCIDAAARRLADSNCCKASERLVHVNRPLLAALLVSVAALAAGFAAAGGWR